MVARAIAGVAAIAAVVPFTVRHVHAVASARRPMLVAGEAIVLLIVLVVYGFNAVYLTLDQRAAQLAGIETRVDAVYFTVTTLPQAPQSRGPTRGSALRPHPLPMDGQPRPDASGRRQ